MENVGSRAKSRRIILVAALGAVSALQHTIQHSPAAPAETTPATGVPAAAGEATPPQAATAAVPVKQVVLFSSGVGYFEHFGTIEGNTSTELRFKSAQINDILKSLVLQDLDKGRVTAVTYPSQDPVEKTLKSFQVDITTNPSLAELLNQLRGAAVKVSVGGRELQGTVLGVEKKQRPAGDTDKSLVTDTWSLNLIADAVIRQVPLDEVRDVLLLDPKLREELHRALAALAAARDQDKKPVSLHFAGEGRRRVRIGYVVETPVWKTSYRLILPGAGAGKPGEKHSGIGGATDLRPDRADPARPSSDPGLTGGPGGRDGGSATLQGWAIVENQTDNDWNDVEMSLVSGRPISFIQDLYQPLYVPRPVVQPELYASLRPQTYDAGMDDKSKQVGDFAGELRQANVALERSDKQRAGDGPNAGFDGKPGAAGVARVQNQARRLQRSEQAAEQAEQAPEPLDPAASVASVASAAKVGELFQYTVGSVSLPRQTSAMIPIVSDGVEAEKLSIYNQSVLPRNPLNGARMKNSTGKHLLAGPLTVLEGGSYAGDARIDDVPPGQERLISFGVDQQVLVDATKNKQEQATLTGKIVKGVLTVSRRYVFTQEYLADNKGDRDKTLLIEHPRRGGEWKLVQPAKADETTDSLYRFRGRVEAGKSTKLTVEEQVVSDEQVVILPADPGQLEVYARTGPIPQPVKEALSKAAGLKYRVADTDRRIQQRQQEVQQIDQKQSRIRENMKTVAPSGEYYNRLLKKLDDQESQIEKLQKDASDLKTQREQQQKELEDYLANLNAGA